MATVNEIQPGVRVFNSTYGLGTVKTPAIGNEPFAYTTVSYDKAGMRFMQYISTLDVVPQTALAVVPAAIAAPTDHKELARVENSIGDYIFTFLETRLKNSAEFRAQELREYIVSRNPDIAPSSPTRILQDMRKKGLIDYELISRSKSFYRALAVNRAVAA